MISSVEKIYIDGNFENYKVIFSDGKISNVPLDEANKDYQAIQEWIADGGTVIDNGGQE
tara:strand:- start:200 stop:376 length:177 start_codon:yes stop_codon:yes gene_type:complete